MVRLRRVLAQIGLWFVVLSMAFSPTVARALPYTQDAATVTIRPPLFYNGHLYTVEYRATGDYRSDSSALFAYASSERFKELGITDLLVRRDGEPVFDEEELYQVFLLYTAADALYRQLPYDPSSYIPPSIREDLQRVTQNPWFIEQYLMGLFASREEQTLEALRAILTPQLKTEAVEQLTDKIGRAMEQGNTAVEAADQAIEAMRFSNNRAFRNLQKDIRRAFQKWRPVTEQGTSFVDIGDARIEFFNALDVIALGAQLLWAAQLNSERAEWLALYWSQPYAGEAALDADQQSAAMKGYAESQEVFAQRANIILQFAREQMVGVGYRLGTDRLARLWVQGSWKFFGKRTTGHLMAGAASAALLGLSLGNLLYNLDEMVSNFRVAERADELRVCFRAGREQLQRRARQSAGDVYDGQLAEAFRAAYMLEALSAAQIYRSYADGVDATLKKGWLSRLNPVNWFKGTEWSEAVAGLRELADTGERNADNAIGHPPYIDTAVALALETALSARAAAPMFFVIIQPGETALLVIELRNTGAAVWTPEQGFALNQLDRQGKPTEQTYPVPQAIAPGEIGRWEIVLPAPGQAYASFNFQMTQNGRPFGQRARAVVITLPQQLQGLEDRLRAAIEEQVEQWRNAAEEELERRTQELEALVAQWIQRELERQMNNLLEQMCSGAALAPLAVVFVFLRRRWAR